MTEYNIQLEIRFMNAEICLLEHNRESPFDAFLIKVLFRTTLSLFDCWAKKKSWKLDANATQASWTCFASNFNFYTAIEKNMNEPKC